MTTNAGLTGYVTISEAAAILGVDGSQVRRYCLGDSQKTLPAIKVGKQWLIAEKDLVEFQRPRVGNPNFQKKS